MRVLANYFAVKLNLTEAHHYDVAIVGLKAGPGALTKTAKQPTGEPCRQGGRISSCRRSTDVEQVCPFLRETNEQKLNAARSQSRVNVA
jgi:hypothetical protein